MLVLLAPGQGAQTPGFLSPWLELPGVDARLRWLSVAAGRDLVTAGTTADADAIRDTAVAQPLLVAAGLLAVGLVDDGDPVGACGAVAGHSVGEVTVASIAGAFAEEAALAFVRERAAGMADAAAAAETGMTAVLGGDPDEVLARAAAYGLEPANHNGAGQLVVAGACAALDAFAADPPERARLRPLEVAGAFHTSYMAPARARLEALAGGLTVDDPRIPVVSNADGALVRHGDDLLRRLVQQVAAPVRWDACLETLAAMGTTAVIELPPAGTLSAMVRRALPGVEVVSLRTPDDLAAASALVAAHRPVRQDLGPVWRMLVAPVAGTFLAEGLDVGSRLPARATVGAIVSQRTSTPVETAYDGVLVEWLAEDGDPVAPGQPLARMHPEPQA